MRNFKNSIALFLASIFTVTLLGINVFATESAVEIEIANITFDKYIDSDGIEHSDSGIVEVEFSKLNLDGQMTLLLSTKEIKDVSGESLSKVIYINQVDVPAYNVVTFPIDKTKIADAIGSEDINNCEMILKVNGFGGSDAAMLKTVFVESTKVFPDLNEDGRITVIDTLLAINLCLNHKYNPIADVNSDEKVSLIDVLRILKLSTTV